MNNQDQVYDGALISELGVKRYLKATKDIKTSNIDFLLRGNAANKAWEECNFGCHGPTYRSLKRPSTKVELLQPLRDLSPQLAGFIDGAHTGTVGKVQRLTGGVERTAEGLHLNGIEKFQQVGDENTAAFEFAKTALENIITFEIDLLDNPISQILMTIISEYTAVLPEWVIEEVLKQGALKFPEKIDTAWLVKAAALGIIENVTAEDIVHVAKLLNESAQYVVSKQIGKKLAPVVAAAIASTVCKKLLKRSQQARELKRLRIEWRNASKTMSGGLGGTLLGLLNAQGWLNVAATSSRELQKTCPRLWQILRYKLNGANMAYFLAENMVQEYVDRIALLEQNPIQFAKVMEALIRDKQTPAIFFPWYKS